MGYRPWYWCSRGTIVTVSSILSPTVASPEIVGRFCGSPRGDSGGLIKRGRVRLYIGLWLGEPALPRVVSFRQILFCAKGEHRRRRPRFAARAFGRMREHGASYLLTMRDQSTKDLVG